MQRREFAFDCVEPRRIGGQVDGLHIVAREEIVGGADVGRQVVHDDVKADLDGITRSELGKTGHNILGSLSFVHSSNQAVGMDIIEGVQLLGALAACIRRPVPLWFSLAGPAHASQRTKLQRAELVVANDGAMLGTPGIQFENPLFLALKSGSSDCFHVLVCCHETPARWSKRRNHSELTEENN
jgi:hypothetical protein